MKRIICIFVVCMLCLCCSACDSNIVTTETDKNTETVNVTTIPDRVNLLESDILTGKKIGCSLVYKGDQWCATLSSALELIAKHYGAQLTCEDGDLNDETQTKQIESMIANGCDIIFIDPVTPDGCTEALKKASEKGIPIIIYDSYWSETDENLVTTVTWDQYQTGVTIGEYFIDYIQKNNDGKCRVIELENAVSTHCQDRFRGFHDTVDKASDCDITFIKKIDTQGNRETAYNAIIGLAEPYDYVISDVDNSAMGAVAALESAGNKKVNVFSMGGYGSESFGKVSEENSIYKGFIDIDPWELADNVFKSAIRYYNGEKNEAVININQFMIDGSNYKDFWTEN